MNELTYATLARLMIAQNVATNGRWFCALLVAINLYINRPGLALLAVVPVGAACLIEQTPAGWVRVLLAFAAEYLLAGFVLGATLLAVLL